MFTVLGILLALLGTIAGAVWLSKVFDRRSREEAPDRLTSARALVDTDRAAALSTAGQAFWASPSRVYRPNEATTAREVLELVREVFQGKSPQLDRDLETIIAEFRDIESEGGMIPGEMLDAAGELLHDVAADRFLAGQLVERADAGELELRLIRDESESS